ncbi:hypothetical protein D3C78_1217570 [compost metagenome]
MHAAQAHLLQVQHRRGVAEAPETGEQRAAADADVLGHLDDGDRLVGVLLDVALHPLDEGRRDGMPLFAAEFGAVVVGLAGQQRGDQGLLELRAEQRRQLALALDMVSQIQPTMRIQRCPCGVPSGI